MLPGPSSTPAVATEPRVDPADNPNRFYCGCSGCRTNGECWVSARTWYRHREVRETEVASGTTDPPDPSHRVPARRVPRPTTQRAPDSAPEIRATQESVERTGNSVQGAATGSGVGGYHPGMSDHRVQEAHNAEDRGLQTPPFAGMDINENVGNQQIEYDVDMQDPDPRPATPPEQREDNAGAAEPRLQPDAPIPDFLAESSRIPLIDTALKFIHALRADPKLEDEDLEDDVLHRLRNPVKEPITLTPDERLSIDLFLADTDGSEKIYHDVREAIIRRHPTDDILSYYLVKKKIRELTGITSIRNDMCPGSCVGYTGPYEDLDTCPDPTCRQSRYDEELLAKGIKKPRRQFTTFPIGPQIQARFRSPEGATEMRHRERQMQGILNELRDTGKIEVLEDVYHGVDFWDSYQQGDILPDDVTLILSMDGAQLYEHKASSCWIYIWILTDLAPDKRYKKKYILPGAIVEGKPKTPDSFLFPGMHHAAALQREGLVIWDGAQKKTFVSRPWIFLAEADAVGAPELHGYVGHHGKQGCRNRCGRVGRRKPGAPHYYAVSLKPDGYQEAGCTHPDYEPSELPEASPAQYEADLKTLQAASGTTDYNARRLATGLSKPSIFLGLSPKHRLPIPNLFPGDIMHLFGLNITDLLVKLWRGTMKCDSDNGDDRATWEWACLVGDVWTMHGANVAAAKVFLPGSFERPPRDPALKMSSGFKCWEFLHWIYGLAPALLHGVLPDAHWRNFCKLAAGVRIVFRRHITDPQIELAHHLLTDFVYEFELLYVQRKVSRIHFLPQCMHAITHSPTESRRIGPLCNSSQFPMERTIGDLGAELRQPSTPFANLTQISLLRCQINGFKASFPEIDPTKVIDPALVRDAGGGYMLLHPRQKRPKDGLDDPPDANRPVSIRRWGRCRLPNRQECRCEWTEVPNKVTRIARNVKFSETPGDPESFHYAEVRFFFQWPINNPTHCLALVSRYGAPDAALLDASSRTVWAARALGDDGLAVIDVTTILENVGMVPYPPVPPHTGPTGLYFAVEKLGVGQMPGHGVEMSTDGQDDEVPEEEAAEEQD
ncbi:hypothetical protein BV25DRAFT_1889570 [Artomyces pyxidatus]|uniref:Uncharacterized protein n=1 Tax=Artomyces pyxidatus TaxID=48021 RepID=A0ACB8STQ4_9AGAM|nr:hypothetical protein BV25DRAFT_1889570 [Artomyces pyxidatus]